MDHESVDLASGLLARRPVQDEQLFEPPDAPVPRRPAARALFRGTERQLAAWALLLAMKPRWSPTQAAQGLLEMAGGHDEAVLRALARIQSANLERATPWGERAAVALRLAYQATFPGVAATGAHDSSVAPRPSDHLRAEHQ